MRVVIRTATRRTQQINSQVLQQVQELNRLSQINPQPRPISPKSQPILTRHRRNTSSLCTWLKGREIKHTEPNSDAKSRRLGTNSCHNIPQKPGAILKSATKQAGAVIGRQQFVAQIAVTMLDVDPAESCPLSPSGGRHKVLNQPQQRVITQQVVVRRHTKATVQQRMSIRRRRLHTTLVIRTGKSSRMRQLQSHQQIVRSPELLPMRPLQQFPELHEVSEIAFMQHQLVGIGTAVGTNRDRFATPHQLRTTQPEILPATTRQVGRSTVFGSIPTLHRQNAPAIADAPAHRR